LLGGAAGITNELEDGVLAPDCRLLFELEMVLGEVDIVDELFD
jgi:hypothetical protein